MPKGLSRIFMHLIQLNPPRGKPRGIFTVREKIDFQFARIPRLK